jgi:4-hydroxybenzoate polyprenyltransferase
LFLLVISGLAVGMLTLLAVVALAGVEKWTRVVPFVGLPVALLVASALLLWHWAAAEAEAAAVREADRATQRRSGPAVR